MTVTSSVNKRFYTGNGSVTTFAINSLSGDVLTGLTIFDDDDVKVYLDGVLKTKTTDYTISSSTPPASFAGKLVNANVVFSTAPANGVAVAIVRDIPVTQELLLSNGNNVPPKPLESQLDKIVVQNQQLAGTLGVDVVRVGSFVSASGINPISLEEGTYLKCVGGQITNATPVAVGVDISNATVTQVATNTSDITALQALKNPVLSGNALKFPQVNAGENAYVAVDLPLPTGYLVTPIPSYDSAQPKRVNFNGVLTARTKDDTANIVLSSASRNLDLATSGANGLADGLTVANNTWYYVYAYSGGYVASTTNGASTLTISTVSQKVVQLPLTLRTDGSANILPFKMTKWNGRFSELVYDVTYDYVASPSTGTTRIASAFSNTSFTSVDASSFVPPIARIANFITRTADAGGQPSFAYREATGKSETQRYAIVSSAPCVNQILDASLTSLQAIEFKISSSNMAIFVTGYKINL
jgi:hypothetical protein